MIPNPPTIIARVCFNDGSKRDVYQEEDGRQFVIGYEGERVYGVWYYEPQPDEPVIVWQEGEPAF